MTDDDTAELLESFADWLDDRYPDDGVGDDLDAMVSSAELLLDWWTNYREAPLSALAESDVREFLLKWSPRQLTMSAEAAELLCGDLADFIVFLGSTRVLRGSDHQVGVLAQQTLALAAAAAEAMTDPANCGPVCLAFCQDTQAEAYDYPVDFFEPQRQGALLRPSGGDPEVAVGQDTDAGPVDPPGIGIPERDQAPRGQSGSRMCDERCERGALFGREPHHAQAQGGLFNRADWGGVHALARGFSETLRYNWRSVYRNILSLFSVRPRDEIRAISPNGISLPPDGHFSL